MRIAQNSPSGLLLTKRGLLGALEKIVFLNFLGENHVVFADFRLVLAILGVSGDYISRILVENGGEGSVIFGEVTRSIGAVEKSLAAVDFSLAAVVRTLAARISSVGPEEALFAVVVSQEAQAD